MNAYGSISYKDIDDTETHGLHSDAAEGYHTSPVPSSSADADGTDHNGRSQDYTSRQKWFILAVVAAFTSADAMNSMILYPTIPQIASIFHTSEAHAALVGTIPRFSRAIFPLYWASLSEHYGRRPVILWCGILSFIGSFASATSTSMTILIVMQILSTAGSSASTPIGAAIVADVWNANERGTAFGIFYLGPLLGATIGPVIGGALGSIWSWTATQWFMTSWIACCIACIFSGLPETSNLNSQGDFASHSRTGLSDSNWTKSSWLDLFKMTIRPLNVFMYLRHIDIAMNICLASITFGVSGSIGISLQSTLNGEGYHLSPSIIGLSYIPMAVGLLLASLFGGRWTDHIMIRKAKRAGRYDEEGNLIVRPEDRIGENAWIAVSFLPITVLVYGWTTEYHVNWLVPLLATFFYGGVSMLIFGFVNPMLAEYMPEHAASLIALNGFGRNILNFAGGTMTLPLAKSFGNGMFFTTITAIALLNIVIIAIISMRLKQ